MKRKLVKFAQSAGIQIGLAVMLRSIVKIEIDIRLTHVEVDLTVDPESLITIGLGTWVKVYTPDYERKARLYFSVY